MRLEAPEWFEFASDEHKEANEAWVSFEDCVNELTAVNLLEAIANANLSIPPALTPWVYKITTAARNAPNFKKRHRKSITNQTERDAICSIAYMVEIDGMSVTKAIDAAAADSELPYGRGSLERYWSSSRLKQFKNLCRAEGAFIKIIQDEILERYGSRDQDALKEFMNKETMDDFCETKALMEFSKNAVEAFCTYNKEREILEMEDIVSTVISNLKDN